MTNYTTIRALKRKVIINKNIIKFIYAKSKDEYESFKKDCENLEEDVLLIVFKSYEVFKDKQI